MKKQYNAPKIECNEIATACILSASGSIDSNSVPVTGNGSTSEQGITSAQAKNTTLQFNF